jgi:hypothetical protein
MLCHWLLKRSPKQCAGNPGAATVCSKAALTRLCPQSGRSFVAARFFNSLAHPGGSAFPPAEVGSPGSLGRGWAILKAGFTFALAEKLFIFQFHNPAGARIVSKKVLPMKIRPRLRPWL